MAEAKGRIVRLVSGRGAYGGKRTGTRRYGGARRRVTRILATALAFVSVAFVATTAIEEGSVWRFLSQDKSTSTSYSVRFAVCGAERHVTCVVDGDTIWLEGTKIRVADIDTPEVSSPSCPEELALGQKATKRLTGLLNQGPFDVLPYERDVDVYGRKLRILSRDGTSLGAMLVEEGLARTWDGSRHPWCG